MRAALAWLVIGYVEVAGLLFVATPVVGLALAGLTQAAGRWRARNPWLDGSIGPGGHALIRGEAFLGTSLMVVLLGIWAARGAPWLSIAMAVALAIGAAGLTLGLLGAWQILLGLWRLAAGLAGTLREQRRPVIEAQSRE